MFEFSGQILDCDGHLYMEPDVMAEIVGEAGGGWIIDYLREYVGSDADLAARDQARVDTWTIKGISALGSFSPRDRVDVFYTMGNHRWRCDKPQGHGSLDLKHALAQSCDVFYYSVGDRAGLDVIAEMARRFGYGAPTGLDLGREIPGIIPDSKTITPESGSARAHAINAAIGQGEINVTPLQQAVAYAAVANGGDIVLPQIVLRIEAPDGKVIREFQPQILRKLGLKDSSLAAVRAGLDAVVNEPGGTAWRSRLQDVHMAGKTGTAQVMKLGKQQKLDPTTQAYFSRDHAWFAAFAPAADPEVVVVVLNEHGGWGAEAAAPAAAKVVSAYFKIKREETPPPAVAPPLATSSVVQ